MKSTLYMVEKEAAFVESC